MNYFRRLRRHPHSSAFAQKLAQVTEAGFDSQSVVPGIKTYNSRANLDRFKKLKIIGKIC